jgi:molecular chaperone DnaK (HSP70)
VRIVARAVGIDLGTSRCVVAIMEGGRPTVSNVVLVGGSTRMPAVADLVKSLTNGKEPDMGSGHSTVAVGAALQAGVLRGEVKEVCISDT